MTEQPNLLIRDIGEHALIERLRRFTRKHDHVLVGIGDDTAVIEWGSDLKQREVLTTDMLLENSHFLRNAETDWFALGRKAAAANISDVAAMGAQPSVLLVSVALPREMRVADAESLYEGIDAEAGKWNCTVVGGDTVSGPLVTISITATGRVADDVPLPLRSSSRAGHRIYVSGALGGSMAGLILILDFSLRHRVDSAIGDALLRRHRTPEPRVSLGTALPRFLPELAMIDISDSLHSELSRLASASNVAMNVDVDAVPAFDGLDKFCRGTGRDVLPYLLFSGEEYELLFTANVSEEQLHEELQRRGVTTPVHCIGQVTEGCGVAYRRSDGTAIDVSDQTFQHF